MFNNKTNILMTMVGVMLSFHASAQTNSNINYLGQKPPGIVAELFAPGIVSTNLYEHSSPAFSPDGRLVVWAVYDNGNYLLESRYENGTWTKPAKPSFTDSLHGYVYPTFSSNGKKLFFSSSRPVTPGYAQVNGNRLWEVTRTEKGWGTPMPFDTTASQGNDYANSISNNGNVYFSSAIRGGTNWNIRRSEIKNGRYTPPELLPYNINSKDYEDGAYIAPDESFLIFESQRPEGTEGNLSLFISFKSKDGRWSIPMNMGPKINSGKGERFARLSPDGKYLFFGSFRNPAPGSRGADIYWIDAKVIDELRNTPAAKIFIEQPLGNDLIAALDKEDVAASSGLLENWLQLYPGGMDALVIYSSVLRRQKRYAEAGQLLAKDATLWSGNPGIVLEMALIKFGLQDDEGAKKLLSPVLEQKMDLRKKLSYLADELFIMTSYTLSDEYFEQANAIRPNGTALYNRACAYALAGDKVKAFTLLNRAVENGFNLRKDFESDEDLQSLKADARWGELQKKLR